MHDKSLLMNKPLMEIIDMIDDEPTHVALVKIIKLINDEFGVPLSQSVEDLSISLEKLKSEVKVIKNR
jgi:hypothetical protein